MYRSVAVMLDCFQCKTAIHFSLISLFVFNPYGTTSYLFLIMIITIIIIIIIITVITRLPSNLRQTTGKCMYLVRHGHFRSCNKDGGHNFRSVMAENKTT